MSNVSRAVDQQTVTRRELNVCDGSVGGTKIRYRDTADTISALLSKFLAIVTMQNDKTLLADACSDSKPFDDRVASTFHGVYPSYRKERVINEKSYRVRAISLPL